ncbi:hypothetical protein ACP0HM_14155 [Escherichia coli]
MPHCSMSRKAPARWALVSRCGFLGLLHMEIIRERLEREYDLDLITTAPTVVYEVETTSREVIYVDSPSKLPAVNNIYELREPIAECHMLLPQAYLGNVNTLCVEKTRRCRPIWFTTVIRVALTYGSRWRKWCSTSSIA